MERITFSLYHQIVFSDFSFWLCITVYPLELLVSLKWRRTCGVTIMCRNSEFDSWVPESCYILGGTWTWKQWNIASVIFLLDHKQVLYVLFSGHCLFWGVGGGMGFWPSPEAPMFVYNPWMSPSWIKAGINSRLNADMVFY